MREAASPARRQDPAADLELRRAREELYRPAPAPGALERYTALLADRGLDTEPSIDRPAAPPPAAARRRRPLRRWPVALAGAVAALSVAAGATVASAPPARARDAAEPLVTDGPYAVTDRDAIDSLVRPGATDPGLLIRAVQGSELPQLDVWDTRPPATWLQQGRGDLRRRFEGQRSATSSPWPFSIVVQCTGAGRYRWSIRGTTAERPALHVLETASAACGTTPSVATFARPAGATARGFDLIVGRGTRWGMAFVYGLDRP